MSEKKESKVSKKLILIVLIVVLAIILLVVFNPFSKKDENVTNEKQNETVETNTQNDNSDSCKLDEVCEEIEMNAYDYIMQVMSEPQYWSADEFIPFYEMSEQKAYCEPIIKEQNATGWRLSDEKTASFTRGAQGVLTINFSNNTAKSDVMMVNLTSEEIWDTNMYTIYKYDFNNDEYYTYFSTYPNEKEYMNDKYANHSTREEWDNNTGVIFDSRWVIEDTLNYYESLFQEAGCPLLNMPEGTLASYKNKTVKFTKHTKVDNLIHEVWKQENYRWDWENLDTYVEIPRNQISTIFDKPVPKDTEIVEFVIDGGNPIECSYYSPVFLVDVNSNSTSKYLKCDVDLFGDLGNYFGTGGAFALYYVQPLMEMCYGYNAVYFVNTDTHVYENLFREYPDPTDKQAVINRILNTANYSREIKAIYPTGERKINHIYLMSNDENTDMKYLSNYIDELLEYYNVESPYADDYLLNFVIMNNMTNQGILGLR